MTAWEHLVWFGYSTPVNICMSLLLVSQWYSTMDFLKWIHKIMRYSTSHGLLKDPINKHYHAHV